VVDILCLDICHNGPPLINISKLYISMLYVDIGTLSVDIVITVVQMDVTWPLAITSHWDVMLLDMVLFFTTYKFYHFLSATTSI
jgi:hypothetical protein